MHENNRGRRPYDDLETDYLEEENESGFLSLISVVIAFLAVAVFIALAWYAYQSSNDSVTMEDIEVVYPEEEVIREAPEDAGGWQFPHQDKSVYNMVAGGAREDVKVEKILSVPEEPVERPTVQTETWLNKKLGDQPIAKTDAERQKEAQVQQEAAKEEEPAPKVDTPDEKVSAPKPEPVVKKEVVEAPKPVRTEAVPATTSSMPTKTRVQLGAFRSRSDANAHWKKVQASHADAMRGKSSYIEVVKLEGKGTFYRLQLVPMSGKDEAKKLCSKLAAKKQACFVVVK